ncbi:MAG: DUF4097 domain-containing protein [Firmicutes bacterium]|nr:DUF4097 domain-containing protein [Bacillota bacterium]
MKALVGVLVVCIALGLVLALAGFSVIGFDIENLNFAVAEDFTREEYTAEGNISKISMEGGSRSPVVIERANVEAITISYPKSEKHIRLLDIKINQQGESLRIYHDDAQSKKQWQAWGFIGFARLPSSFFAVKILLPSGFNGELSVSAKTADIRGSNLGAFSKFQAEVTTGYVNLGGITANEINVKSTTGYIRLANSQALAVRLNSTTGYIRCENVTASSELSAKATTGAVSLSGVTSPKISVEVTTGDIDIKVNGTLSDYRLHLSANTGKCYLNHQSVGKPYIKIDGEKSLTAKATTGNVRVNF